MRKMYSILITSFLLSGFSLVDNNRTSPQFENRIWKSATGEILIQGGLLMAKEGHVFIKKNLGIETIEFSQLSPEDQLYLTGKNKLSENSQSITISEWLSDIANVQLVMLFTMMLFLMIGITVVYRRVLNYKRGFKTRFVVQLKN